MFHPSHLWSKNQREPNRHGILESSGIKRQNQKTRFENTNRWTTRKKNFSKFIEHVFHYTSQRCWEGNFRRTKKIRANEPWKKFHVRYVAPSRIPLERLIGSLSLSFSSVKIHAKETFSKLSNVHTVFFHRFRYWFASRTFFTIVGKSIRTVKPRTNRQLEWWISNETRNGNVKGYTASMRRKTV